MSQPLIELRRLFRFFGKTRAVNDISFEVCAGQVFGYIGPNGAGKSTSMRILATLETPSYGDAYVDGFSVVTDPDRVRKRVGFMPDYFGTYANMNCREYLDFFARAYGLLGKERDRAMAYVMGFTKLEPLAQKPIRGLSKGMKQRLCLARTMIHDPGVLILDEPAAGLDPRARIELRDMIVALAAKGKAILISSHILTELAEMCDRIGIIERGRLLATGTVEEIRQRYAPQREVRVRTIGEPQMLLNFLNERPDLKNIRVENDTTIFSHGGRREDEAELLRALVQTGIPVAEFAGHVTTLETVFMEVTRGEVQ